MLNYHFNRKVYKSHEKEIPEFTSEDKERKYWAKQDSTEVLDWKKARKVVLPMRKA